MQELPSIGEKHAVCEGYVLEKYHKQPFSNGVAWRAKEKLELVHTDMCCPMNTLSHG